MAGRKVIRKWQLVEREIEDQIAERVIRHKFPDWASKLDDPSLLAECVRKIMSAGPVGEEGA